MTSQTWTDPIVDEIHKIRDDMAREAGYDLRTLVAQIRQRTADSIETPQENS